MSKDLRVTRGDVRDNLAKWILKGQAFHTPVRETCGMWQTVWNYPITASTISGHLTQMGDKTYYVVYSYKTPIMRVEVEELCEAEVPNTSIRSGVSYRPVSAEFDNRKYSATTNLMQGYCQWALRQLFGIGFIPDVIGKRGGHYQRRNFMGVQKIVVRTPLLNTTEYYQWTCIDPDTGELRLIHQDGDPYNGDTEGYY